MDDAAAAGGDERIDKGAGSPVEAQHIVQSIAGYVQIAVRPKKNARWVIQPASGRKGVYERSRCSIEAQDGSRTVTGDVEVAIRSKCQSQRIYHPARSK